MTSEDPLARLAREEGGRVLALLARRFGDLDLAEDAVQEALADAARTWPAGGVPDNPAGWLLAVARRRALDLLRKDASLRRRAEHAAADPTQQPHPNDTDPMLDLQGGAMVPDERLRLILLCCHPALDRDTQVALVLRLVGGLSTTEVAAAFLVPEATAAQRIVRAKRKIREARIPMTLPDELDDRLGVVLAVLYLVFNEGYLSRSGQAGAVRVDLVQEAVRLTRLVAALAPGQAEVEGLLALELFATSRAATRTDPGGKLVLLAEQDRTAWDLSIVQEANTVLAQAIRRMQPGPYQLQAVIAAQHANARTADETDWSAIAAAYRQLVAMTGSPVVALNHAVAVAMADGPDAGLRLLDRVDGLAGYHLFHAARADLLRRAGREQEAAQAYGAALDLAANPAEQAFLRRRLAGL